MLLHKCLLLLELSELSLHVLILVLLLPNLRLEVVEVGDDEGVHDFDVFIIERLQVVVHHSDVLTQAFDLLFVFTQNLSRGEQVILNGFDMKLHVAVCRGTTVQASIRRRLLDENYRRWEELQSFCG